MPDQPQIDNDGAPEQPIFKKVSVELIDFDPENPRFGGKASSLSQAQIQKVLEGPEHVARELVASFLENGYIKYEPLVVREVDSRYQVIEGNRRLAALKHILSNPDGKYKPEQIERLREAHVLVFPGKQGESQMEDARVYLGVHHLFGYRDWPPESKAKFLDQHIKSEQDLARVARELNLKTQHIRRYLVPFRLKQKMSRQLIAQIGKQDFWILGESLSRRAIQQYIQLEVDPGSLEILRFDGAKLKFLVGFVYGAGVGTKRIVETRDIRPLASVLSSKRARDVLERGTSLEEALLYAENPEESAKRLMKLLKEIRILLKKLRPRWPEEIADLERHFKPFETSAKALTKHV
jgi:hypothetical protein